MKFGVVFPHVSIEPDRQAITDYAQAVEAMGFSHIVSYDHVLGANTANRPGWRGYDLDSRFHEAFALLSFIAAITSRIGLATGILILPQRQAVLVAKQAATLDLLSGGRFRLGVGTGWNAVEYEALGTDFAARGKIFDEQLDVLRALWTQRAVTMDGTYHSISDAGLFPMPLQQPIPLWLGGGGVQPISGAPAGDRVVRRIAQKADGWIPAFAPDDRGAEIVERFRGYCVDYGRDPADIGIEAVLTGGAEPDWVGTARAWQHLGATHVSLDTMTCAVEGVEAHLRCLDVIRQGFVDAGLWPQ